MANISAKLQDLAPTIRQILNISGVAGASIGIFHHNEVFTAGYGHRDIEKGLTADENSVYHLASLSKSFTAAAIGILVDENKLDWDQKMGKVLPGFNHGDGHIGNEATVLDFLSHRTGLATKNALWQQDGPELLLDAKDVLPLVSYLEVIEPLRSKWIYNNWGYDVGAKIIEQVSGQTWGSFINEKILEPLALSSTYTSQYPPAEQWAQGYMPAPGCRPTNVGRPLIYDGTVMQGANGIKSTVKDLLIYYRATLDAFKQENGQAPSDQEPSRLKNVKQMLTGHIALDHDSPYEQAYGTGWAITQLPAPLGSMGTNGMFLSKMPIVGKGGNDTTVWYHNGSLVGFFSSVHVLPDTDTVIVVLVNSIPKNDCADWLGQLLVGAIIDNHDKNDYVALAVESADAYDRMWTQLKDDFKKSETPNQSKRPLTAYEGKYYNKLGNWFIKVFINEDKLQFQFQGRSTQMHRLKPHGSDTFGWLLSESESRQLARWPDLDVPTYLFQFEENKDGNITQLRWCHDPDVPKGEVFVCQGEGRVNSPAER